tara:strand:+ start:55 stop:621 length:567 start_codon:yes stop_codon:yes gene_type:complete
VSTCVIVLKEKQLAKELLLKLGEAQTPIRGCDLVKPLKNKMNPRDSTQEIKEEDLSNQVDFENVKLLNPLIAKKERQKNLAIWLIPFGFITGLSFSQMTGLETFADMGFPNQFEKLLGGIVGMISGLLGSFFAAGGINQDINDDLQSLRKKSTQGFWLLIIETPLEIELPWAIFKEIDIVETITIDKE